MKRILIALVVITSLSATAQESVLLRLNYAKGDNYVVSVDSKQSMGKQGEMHMKTTMRMRVTEVAAENIKTESQIKSIAMKMTQGGMSMSYDSNMKDEELDQMGQMMKSQFDPMMKATIYNAHDRLGNMVETKIKPAVAGMEQLNNNSGTIIYPKERITVGSSWTSKNENQGMKMTTNYTVSSIANGVVTLDISGEVSGVGTGAVKGKTKVDSSSGVPIRTALELTISTKGIDIKITTNTTTKKI